MIPTIKHKGNNYPAFQASGNAARFIIPFAQEVCKGDGLDIGCNREEWCFPGAFPVDPLLGCFDAYNVPDNLGIKEEANTISLYFNDELISNAKSAYVYKYWDYIFSSHCIEHLPNWVQALDYWHSRLKSGGVVFLYLPDHSQTYWRGWCNRKHLHMLTPEIVGNYFKDQPEMWTNVFVSGVDLNNSFAVMAEKI